MIACVLGAFCGAASFVEAIRCLVKRVASEVGRNRFRLVLIQREEKQIHPLRCASVGMTYSMWRIFGGEFSVANFRWRIFVANSCGESSNQETGSL
jgi:hypothetical protein